MARPPKYLSPGTLTQRRRWWGSSLKYRIKWTKTPIRQPWIPLTSPKQLRCSLESILDYKRIKIAVIARLNAKEQWAQITTKNEYRRQEVLLKCRTHVGERFGCKIYNNNGVKIKVYVNIKIHIKL